MNYLEDNLNMPLSDILAHMQRRILRESTYFGIPTLKNPMDFWVYRELIFETRPDVIIESGIYAGGSTLALAHICDHLGGGRVIGIDPRMEYVPPAVHEHPRITLLEGRSTELFDDVKALIEPHETVMVIEDSSHTYDNTLAVLRCFQELVKPGDYFIVEDSICGHGLDAGPSPGPYEAIETFLGENPHFESDRSRESFLITWNIKGFLKRLAT